MLAWLYRYVIRGIGILLALGMITIFLVSVASQVRQNPHPTATRTQTAP